MYGFSLDPKYKNEVFELFTTGIKIDEKVYDQERITNAKIKKKIIFFPTYAVSY